MDNTERRMHQEAEAAKTLLETLRDDIGNDEELAVDVVEGETGLLEVIDAALFADLQDKSFIAGIQRAEQTLADRRARLTARIDNRRAAIHTAMQLTGLSKVLRPLATITRRRGTPKPIIKEEADIPSDFWTPQPPKLDKAALGQAIRDGGEVPGVVASNATETMTIRFK